MSKSIVTKTCTKCKIEQPTSNFYKDASAKSGLCFWCKTCIKAHRARYRKSPTYQECRQQYYSKNKHGILTHNAQYRKSEQGKAVMKRARAKYNANNAQKRQAKEAVHTAIRAGRMLPPGNSICPCGQPAEHYHHPSYAPEHWLDVIPLCIPCHKKEHRCQQ